MEQKERIGFKHADSVGEALETALSKHGKKTRIGIIAHGGDVLPIPD